MMGPWVWRDIARGTFNACRRRRTGVLGEPLARIDWGSTDVPEAEIWPSGSAVYLRAYDRVLRLAEAAR